jgi:hypothetical protein
MSEDHENADLDAIVAQAFAISNRRLKRVEAMNHDRDTQPERLARARAEAEEARELSLLVEPWEAEVSALRGYTGDGQTGTELHLPNMVAKQVFGARLAFDALDCADGDGDLVKNVLVRYFSMVRGDTGLAMLLLASALETICTLVVPQLLEEIEQRGSNYDARVMLAEARTKAWSRRVCEARAEGNELARDDASGHGSTER